MSTFSALERRIPGATVPPEERGVGTIDTACADVEFLKLVATGLRKWNPELSPISRGTVLFSWPGPAVGRTNGGSGHWPRHARGTIYDTRPWST